MIKDLAQWEIILTIVGIVVGVTGIVVQIITTDNFTPRKRVAIIAVSLAGILLSVPVIIRAIGLIHCGADCHYKRGMAKKEIGEFDAAINELEEAIQIDSKFFKAYLGLGYIYEEIENWELAIYQFSNAINCNPRLTWAYYHRGLVRLQVCNERDNELERCERAIDDFNMALRLLEGDGRKADMAPIYCKRGAVYLTMQNPVQALVNFDKAIQLNPGLVGAFYGRCQTYKNLEDDYSAIDDCTMTIELNPRHARAYNARGEIYLSWAENGKTRYYQFAIDDFTNAISANGSEIYWPWYHRGRAYYGCGEYELALSDFETFLRIAEPSRKAMVEDWITELEEELRE